jgi:hypothetical protein
MAMEPFSEQAASIFKLKPNDDWLRRRQGLALPALPPTTPEARQYFFSKIREFSGLASSSGRKSIDYEKFAQEWNGSADGKTRFYITTEVLSAYAKTWERTSNIRASKELMLDKINLIQQSAEVFAAPQTAFPDFLTGSSISMHPRKGVIDLQTQSTPPSLSTDLAISHPPIIPSTPQSNLSNAVESDSEPLPQKRRRVVANPLRQRTVRTCRRCRKQSCPGNSDILNCDMPCTVPCAKCGQLDGCRGVDGGRKCSN